MEQTRAKSERRADAAMADVTRMWADSVWADDGSNLHGMSQDIAPAASMSGGVQLDSVILQEKIRDDVHKKVLELSIAYMEFREKLVTQDECLDALHSHVFPSCPIVKKPPGFDSQVVDDLSQELQRCTGPPCFMMSKATFILDPANGEDVSRSDGDSVSFEGRQRYYPAVHEKGLGQESNLYVARQGFSKVPPNAAVKPWKFQVVRKDPDPSDNTKWTWTPVAGEKIYVCVFVPFTPSAAPSIAKRSHPDEEELTPEIRGLRDSFVTAIVQQAQQQGMLSEGENQVERFRKSLTTSIDTMLCKFVGPKSNPKWADKVFRPGYGRMQLEEVLNFIKDFGHLPWIRPEGDVKLTGIKLEDDHVNLLEAVENLFLLLMDMSQRVSNLGGASSAPESKEEPLTEEYRHKFLIRLLAYSDLSPKRFQRRQLSDSYLKADLNVAMKITTIVGGDLNRDPQNIAKCVRKRGKDQSLAIAREAVRRKNAGETSKSAVGECFHLFKQNFDPIRLRYAEQSRSVMSQQHIPLKPRGYQEEMAAKALSGNSLLVVPTGCGKTKVIAMVLDDMWRSNPAAKAIFVADRIPLALQQSQHLKKWCTPFDSSAKFAQEDRLQGPNIGSYNRNNPYPDLKKSSWTEFLERHDLFVFTPDMLLNLIRDAKLPSLSMFDYFVIDEAHHTIKSHPFNKIMDFLKGPRPDGSGSSNSQLKRPKILAVTATVGGKSDQEQSFAHLQTLAKNVNCTVIVKDHLSDSARNELKEYTAQPTITQIYFRVSPLEKWFQERAKKLEEDFRGRLRCNADGKKVPSSSTERTPAQIEAHQQEETFRRFADALVEAVLISDDFGVHEAMVWLAGEYLSIMCEDNPRKSWHRWIQMQFMLSQIFEPTSSLPRTVVEEQGHSLFDEQGYVLRKEPEKQKHLFRQLATLKEEVTDFRCIVFFKTRHGVKTMFDRMTSLERMFACEGDGNLRTDRPSENASDEDVLRCHFSGEKRLRFRKFVGQGSCRVSENFASQERTRQQFLKGECNLLLATSIADEGLDFPACNTVILMNGADNDIALHQRIGRVRSDGSAVIFVNEGSEQRLLEQAESNGQNAEAALARWASPMGGCGDIAE